jgi:hypothetical protein
MLIDANGRQANGLPSLQVPCTACVSASHGSWNPDTIPDFVVIDHVHFNSNVIQRTCVGFQHFLDQDLDLMPLAGERSAQQCTFVHVWMRSMGNILYHGSGAKLSNWRKCLTGHTNGQNVATSKRQLISSFSCKFYVYTILRTFILPSS